MSYLSPIVTTQISTADIENMTVSALLDPITLAKVQELVWEIINAGEPIEAKRLCEAIEEKLEDVVVAKDNIYQEYVKIADGLKFMYLTFATEDEIEMMFQYSLKSALELDIDVRFYLTRYLSTVRIEEDIGRIRGMLIKAMYQNTQELGQYSLVIKENDRVKPIIKHWMLDYDLQFEGPKGPLQEVEYLGKSVNIGQLNSYEKIWLRRILQLYDFLRYPLEQVLPEWPERLSKEEWLNQQKAVSGEQGILPRLAGIKNNVEPTPVIKEDKNFIPPQTLTPASTHPANPILAAFNALPIPLDQIQAKMADLQARMSNQPKILEQILGNSERVKDKAYVVAALMLAVRRKGSEPADSDGSEPFFPSRIRDILEQKLGWSAEDSAKIGIRIANILGVSGWAHYHRERGRFEWAG